MKFNIQSKLLFTHLQAVSKVVNSKNTISILNNFLFTLSGNTLVITASDQETTLTTHVEVTNAEGSGKFAAGVKELLDMLKELPDQGLAVDINDQNLAINISYMNGEFNFIGLNGNEFPVKAPSSPRRLLLCRPTLTSWCASVSLSSAQASSSRSSFPPSPPQSLPASSTSRRAT